MSNPVHQEISKQMLAIYYLESRSLPDWDLILEAIQLAKIEPTFDNIRYANWLFYALEDLFKIVKNSWVTTVHIDEANHTVTLIKHDLFTNKVGVIDSEPFTYSPNDIRWDAFYKGKTLDELNRNPYVNQVDQFEYEVLEKNERKMELLPEDFVNERNVREGYKHAFEPVINRDFARISFVRFIERIQSGNRISSKFGTPELVNRHQHLLNYYNMPEFQTEIRSTFGNEYVKVFLKDQTRFQEIQIILNGLPSIKRVNITENNETDLTVYPGKFSTAKEIQAEITSTLNVVFAGKPSDPIIKDDVLDGISEPVYKKILNLISYFGKNLEKFSSLHSKFDEEGFREYFLPFLNVMSDSHSATGETFNKIGKTDILIQNQKGENVFIAECKVWGGEGEVTKAVDQLLERYVTWRDEKVSLIIFNKTVQGFSAIVTKAIDALKKHPSFKEYKGQVENSRASFIFKHPEDPEKTVELELMMFNCTGN